MFDSIDQAIQEIREGKLVIVVDDDDRENEGDFICAASAITPEVVNFMTKYGRGLICVPLTESRCEELSLEMMVNNNTALHETAFTVSVDLLGHDCSTGISAQDRSKTIKALIDPQTSPADLGRPGFPLAEIRREVELTRKRGYSLDDEEFNLGVRCLAAPVYSSDGLMVAAIGITAPGCGAVHAR